MAAALRNPPFATRFIPIEGGGASAHRSRNALRQYWPVPILLLAGLVVSLPLLTRGFPDLSNDGIDHVRYDSNFAAQFWRGELYPRWLSDVNGGLGAPSLYFYPPLQSFVASLFWPWMKNTATQGWGEYSQGFMSSGWACAVATILAGLTCYFWLRRHSSPGASLFGSLTYMLAPYHLAIDLYNRGAAAEYWIFVWLPLVMIAAEGIAENRRGAIPGLAAAYALCVYSHATVSACAAVLPLAYVLTFSARGRRLRQFCETTAALALGLGLSAIYLLPAVLDQSKTWVALQTEGWGDYRHWWLFQIRDEITATGTEGAGIPWYLSYKMRILVITMWTLFFSACAYRLIPKTSDRRRSRRRDVFFLSVIGISFFLMLRQSELVWRVTPLLRMMQFPHRLSTFMVLGEAALACAAFPLLMNAHRRMAGAVVILSLVGWAVAGAISARQAYSGWRYIPQARAERAADLLSTQQEYFSFWPRPSNVIEYSSIPKLKALISANPPRTAHLVTPAAGSATVLSWRPRHSILKVDAPAGGDLLINHFYMRGWRARIDGRHGFLSVIPSAKDGFLLVRLPPGSSTVHVELPLDGAERIGLALTLGSAVLLVLMLWNVRRTRLYSLPGSPETNAASERWPVPISPPLSVPRRPERSAPAA